MQITNFNSSNMFQMQGRIVSVTEYSTGKAANVNMAVDNGCDREPLFIQLKSFRPSMYNTLKVGMKVRVYGHIHPNRYEKNGQMIYQTNPVADHIEMLEARAVVEERERRKSHDA